MDGLKQAAERVCAALISSFKTKRRSASTLSLSFFVFFIFAFNTNIPWNIDLLSNSIFNIGEVILNGYSSFIIAGELRLLSVLVYSFLVGAAITNFGAQLTGENFNKKSLATVLPGFVAGGCGCGIGLLGILGLGGATLALPFQGQLIVYAGIILVVYALYDLGSSDVCDVKINVES